MEQLFTRFATRTASAAGQPLTFFLAVAVIFVWLVTGPIFAWSETWQLIINTATTIITFLMVFVIQNSQNRDAAAIQAKLDELIRAVAHARNQFIGIEHLSERELEEIRATLEREAAGADPRGTAHRSVHRMIERV